MAEMRPATLSPRRERQARIFFDTAVSLFGALGLRDAERSIRHYRDGTGTDIRLTGRDVARHPLIDLGVRANRSRFETLTLPGKPDNDNSARLCNMKDGDTISFEDNWSRDFNLGYRKNDLLGYPKKLWEDLGLLTNPDTYLTFGRVVSTRSSRSAAGGLATTCSSPARRRTRSILGVTIR